MITIVRESEEMGTDYEDCYRCGTPTPYWSELRDIPVCPECAKVLQNGDLPSKREWIKG